MADSALAKEAALRPWVRVIGSNHSTVDDNNALAIKPPNAIDQKFQLSLHCLAIPPTHEVAIFDFSPEPHDQIQIVLANGTLRHASQRMQGGPIAFHCAIPLGVRS
jgi:hypothetical protein